ncbi:MAG: thioredoxin family protein [Bacteroidales bacterium]|nr:thioredoxin family protein [Bacteroidales bacterium]
MVAKYNIGQEDASVITKRYNISAIPCLVVFENGKEIGRNVGYMTKTELLTWLKKYMK